MKYLLLCMFLIPLIFMSLGPILFRRDKHNKAEWTKPADGTEK